MRRGVDGEGRCEMYDAAMGGAERDWSSPLCSLRIIERLLAVGFFGARAGC